MTLNLDTLKQEVLDYLAVEKFVVFRGSPGGLAGTPMVFWDSDGHPDYRDFLGAAKGAGARMIIFAHREFDPDKIDDALEQLRDCELPREEARTFERNLKDLRPFAGSTCTLEISFDYQGRMYVYELVTEWFQNFIDLSDLLIAASDPGDDEEEDEDDPSPLGGYYSKN